MTAAEMKTLRESLGLPVSWVAQQAGVTNRTVEYWESGRSAVPDDVASQLASIDRFLDYSAKRAGPPLLRYRSNEALWADLPEWSGLPVTAHAAMLARARRRMASGGAVVAIQYAE